MDTPELRPLRKERQDNRMFRGVTSFNFASRDVGYQQIHSRADVFCAPTLAKLGLAAV